MKLDRVAIKNFRSIQEIEIRFEKPCRVLVGINESGKSNILSALALLGNDCSPIKKDDLREALPDEAPITESLVNFVFKFEKAETDKLRDTISLKILSSAKNPNIFSINGKAINITEFCATHNEGQYEIDILKEDKSFLCLPLSEKYQLLPGWKKPSASCPQEFHVELQGKKNMLTQYKLVRVADLPDIPEGYLEEANIDDLAKIADTAITDITEETLPDTLYWKYDEKNLLPNTVKIAEFAANPDLCVPLKNMFALAGIDDIQSGIETAKKGTQNQFQNYLNRIATQTTNHFREVWGDYKDIEFSLRLNADNIIPGVKETNTHDFARRSDGFKRFVTFLLMISVNVRTDNLNDTLLLIDEPETGLHPTGARYLRDELIRISKTNYVVYSTHSIFMIDSGDLNRHYIVKKKNEVTNVETAESSNIADEEVLYQALGHSVFAILKEKNLIFEGWKDKHLFRVALDGASDKLKGKFREVGVCHARGAGTIKAITPMIELANRKCVIVSDSDKPAREQQKIYKQEKGFGSWKTYQEIDSTIEAITGEDFVKNDFIIKQIKAALSGTSMPSFDEAALPAKKGKLAAIHKWLTDNGMTTDQAKNILTEIKESIFDGLKSQNVDSAEYTKLLQGISLEHKVTGAKN